MLTKNGEYLLKETQEYSLVILQCPKQNQRACVGHPGEQSLWSYIFY